MKVIAAFVFAGFLGTAVMAYGGTIVIDNFTCADSVSTTGPVFARNVISCASAIGGARGDSIFFTGGSGSSSSTLTSGGGEITGTIGSGLTGVDILGWFGTTTPGVFDLPNLDLVGDSILVQIKSDTAGTLDATFGSGSVASANLLSFSTTFAASSSFVDVLIPLTDPAVLGTGANLNDVTAIGLQVGVPGGGTWTIDGVAAVPEPSTLLLTGICFLGILKRSIWRRSSRQ
jgi:hypothetical protein